MYIAVGILIYSPFANKHPGHLQITIVVRLKCEADDV